MDWPLLEVIHISRKKLHMQWHENWREKNGVNIPSFVHSAAFTDEHFAAAFMSRELLFKQEHRWRLGLWMISSHFDSWNTDGDGVNGSEVGGGRREQTGERKSCLSSSILLEEQPLNRRGFPDIVRFFLHIHAHACKRSPSQRPERFCIVISENFMSLLPSPLTARLSIRLLADRKKRQHCQSVLSAPLAPIHVLHPSCGEWWMVMTPGRSNCN